VSTLNCTFCGRDVPGSETIHRRDTCPYCERELHVCLNCEFYDPRSYRQCRESNAEFVGEKDKANFCDYFRPVRKKRSFVQKSADARRKLEELFKKPED
jgi:hypothetical protein